jgi:signal transduction histidine kinase
VQEALTNTAKHAQARKVRISLKEETDAVYAMISDDGHGFDAETLLKTPDEERGLGLAGMQERAILLDGTLTITSRPQQGTTIEARIPLRPGEPLHPLEKAISTS